MDVDASIQGLRTLRLAPGDVLIVEVDPGLTQGQIQRVQGALMWRLKQAGHTLDKVAVLVVRRGTVEMTKTTIARVLHGTEVDRLFAEMRKADREWAARVARASAEEEKAG